MASGNSPERKHGTDMYRAHARTDRFKSEREVEFSGLRPWMQEEGKEKMSRMGNCRI